MFVIGLVGKTASGKGMVANILEEQLKACDLTVSRMRFSDSLREFIQELRKRGINLATSKENLISIAEAGRISFTPDFLAQSVVRRTRNSNADVCIWDGMRWLEDLEALKVFEYRCLVAIKTLDNVRYQRFLKRKENIGDADISYDNFKRMDGRDTEKLIPRIIKLADVVIVNNKDHTEDNISLPVIEKILYELAYRIYINVTYKPEDHWQFFPKSN